MAALVNEQHTVPPQRTGSREQLTRTPREAMQEDDRRAIAGNVGHGNRNPMPLNEQHLFTQRADS